MDSLKNKWFLLMANAIIAIIAGVIFLFVPHETLATIGFAAGILILISGLFLVFGAFSYAKEGKNMFFWLLEGLVNLSLGIILIVEPTWLIQFILLIIGLWAIILGVFQLYTGFVNSTQFDRKNLMKINGLVTLLIGAVLIFRPEMVAGWIIQLLGVLSILVGTIMMYFAFLIKRVQKEVEESQKFEAAEVLKEDGSVGENHKKVK